MLLVIIYSWKKVNNVTYLIIKKILKIFFPILGFALFLALSGQADLSSSSAPSASLAQGNQLWRAAKYDAAYAAWRQAQHTALATGDSLTWATALRKAGMYLVQQTRIAEATATLDSVITLAGRWDSLHPVIVKARLSKASLAMMQSDVAGAQQQYYRLLAALHHAPEVSDSLIAMTYEPMGRAMFFGGLFDSAIVYCQKALAIYDTLSTIDPLAIANTYNTLGGVSLFSGKTEAALEYYLKTSKIREQTLGAGHPEVLKVKTNIGVVYGEMGLFWESLATHEENIPYLDSLPPLAHANGLLNMGSTLIAVGNYEDALAYFDLAENWLDAHPGLSPDAYPYMYLHLSTIYQELDEPDSALKYINLALLKNHEIFGARHTRLTTDYLQKGSLLAYMGDYDGAIVAFEQVISLQKEFVGKESLRGAHGLNFIGEAYVKKQEPKKAMAYFQQAEAMYHMLGDEIDRAKVLANIAQVQQEWGDWEACLASLKDAWEAQLPEFPFTLTPGIAILKYWRRHEMADVFEQQARIFHQQFKTTKAIEDTAYLRYALQSARIALAVTDSFRYYYQSSAAKQLWLEEQLPLYERAAEIACELHQMGGDRQSAEVVFSLTEKRKAHNLRNHLQGMKAISFAGVPDSLVLKERFFRQRLAALDAQLAGRDADDSLHQARLTLNRSYHQLIQQIETDFPKYHQLKFAQHEALIPQLTPGQAMYSYLWGENHVYVSRWFEGKIDVTKIVHDTLDHALDQWLSFISGPPQSNGPAPLEVAQFGVFLTESLLPELTEMIEQVVIIPDGKLGYLPFESLLSTVPTDENYRVWPYLARRHSTTYAYAAELWMNQQKVGYSDEPATYLGFAPDFEGELLATVRSKLGVLLHNQEEVQQVADLLGGKATLGDQAQEKMLKGLDDKSRILHFATHAIADDETQVNSRLYFAPATDTADDGILHAHEIYGLSLNSPLTVLSACQTGQGPILGGEGIMSLARAFQYSGSQRVLTTLWKTDDRAAAALTTHFFEGIVQGHPTAEALQQARVAWMDAADNFHNHPYYWAGYVLIGDGGIVKVGRPNAEATWLWWGLGVLGFAFIVWGLRKRLSTSA